MAMDKMPRTRHESVGASDWVGGRDRIPKDAIVPTRVSEMTQRCKPNDHVCIENTTNTSGTHEPLG